MTTNEKKEPEAQFEDTARMKAAGKASGLATYAHSSGGGHFCHCCCLLVSSAAIRRRRI